MRTRYIFLLTLLFLVISAAGLGFLVRQGVQQPQNAQPSEAVGTNTDPAKCQGNPNASAKCFKCSNKKTDGAEQVNQLDFASCFKTFYGQTVGTP